MYPFLSVVYYWRRQLPRTATRKGKQVQVGGGGPTVLKAVLRDGVVVPVDLRAEGWQDVADGIPAEDIVGMVTESSRDGRWYGEYRNARYATCAVGYGFGFGNPTSAGLAVRDAYEADATAELMVLADPVARLDRELSCHDWHCHMSDAPGVCGAGQAHMRKIKQVMEDVPDGTARDLWAKHAPEGFACPV